MPAKVKRPQLESSPWESGRNRMAAERLQKRSAVLTAAAQAFSDSGYHATSLDEIAQRLQISKPTLYYYSKNKQDLLGAVIAHALELVLGIDSDDANAHGIDQMKAFCRRYGEVVATDFGRCLVQLKDADLGPEASGRVRDCMRTVDRRLRALIRKGVEDGTVAPCDVRLTAFMVAGALNGIARWFDEEGQLSASSVVEIMVNKLATGLMPRD